MSTIAIRDLPESVELDHEAMLAISGGARLGGRPHVPGRPRSATARIIDYPAGFAAGPAADAGGRSAGSRVRK